MKGHEKKDSAADFYAYEIFLSNSNLPAAAWQKFLHQVAKYLGRRHSWQIIATMKYNTVHYYLVTPRAIPINLANGTFLLKATNIPSSNLTTKTTTRLFWNTADHNLITIGHKLAKQNLQISELNLTFYLSKQTLHGVAKLITANPDQTITIFRLILFTPAALLSINFEQNQSLSYKKVPKYLKLDKHFDFVNQNSENALLQVDAFPYAESDFYLHLRDFDFAKHSLILGSSGAGKSKLISLLLHDIARQAPDQYKIVVIDPHDNLKHDLADINNQIVLDFRTLERSVDLFKTKSEDINAAVELTLSLLQNLFDHSYNGQIERVLRFSTYLLLAKKQLSFLTLRKLLTDLEYRMRLVAEMEGQVPLSVTRFFLTDYNEIKNQFYKDSIAPIVAFIDEMQMVPVFNRDAQVNTLSDTLSRHFLSVFSLNRLSLGNKVTQTIAGLLMQQLFLLVQTASFTKHLIIVVDEVAAIENPILARFLSELRKYHTSIILAGQYFTQVSEDLRASILANTANFYTFRVSKNDANLIVQNLEMKLVGEKSKDDEIELLTHLENRACIARVSRDGKLLPAFRGKTMDCPDLEFTETTSTTIIQTTPTVSSAKYNFTIDTKTSPHDIMKSNSTNRKKLS